MGKRVGLILSIVAVVAMCGFIFYMSSFPADESTELSMGVVWHIIGFIVPGYDQMSLAEQLYWQEALDHPVRKTAHFLEYAVLGALMLNMLWQIAKARRTSSGGEDTKTSPLPRIRNLAIGAWALATAYAVTDEIHQMFIPGRAGMVTDVLLDSAGVLVGVAIVAFALRSISRRKQAR